MPSGLSLTYADHPSALGDVATVFVESCLMSHLGSSVLFISKKTHITQTTIADSLANHLEVPGAFNCQPHHSIKVRLSNAMSTRPMEVSI